jgi:DNA-directed RNA polymerase specialized sigma24 family protein
VAENKGPPAEMSGKVQHARNENEGYAAVHLRDLICALPARQREALCLRYFAGLD